jgi:AcrR family transcriptional regulator
MGIKERQERDRTAVRRSILDAARELFVAEGYGNVSIRKIAERIEYSPAALYGYFPSKDDIFFALADEGFALIDASVGDDSLDALPPLECVREAFWRFYRFSRDYPQYFALMFVDRTVPRVGHEYEAFAQAHRLKAQIIARLQICIDAGELPPTLRPQVAVHMLTVGILGVAAMRMSGRLGEGEHPDALARDLLDVTIAGLQSNLPLRTHALPCPLKAGTDEGS